MTTFENNMIHLKTRDEILYNRVLNNNETNYVLIHNEDSSINIYSKKDDQFLYPFSDVQEWIEKTLVDSHVHNLNLCFLLGCGIGYELTTLVKDLFKVYNTKYLIIIEKDIEMFKRLMEVVDISELIKSESISFVIGYENENIYVAIRELIENNDRTYFVKSTDFIGNKKIISLNNEYYSKVAKSIREALVGLYLSVGNDPFDSLVGIQNMFHNINEIIYNPGVKLLEKKFSGKPAVIASTGPSLDKNVHLLKGLEDKVLIICPDASLKILLSKGIKPHIVVSLERTNGILKFYNDLTENDLNQTYFVFTPVVTGDVLDAFKGRKFVIYRDYKHFDWLEIDKGKYDIKSSSGNMAFKVAQALGCDPIVLIGQDLAFSKDGNTHAKGMALGNRVEEHYDRGVVEVLGNDGNMIKTSMIMFPFIKEFELDLSKHAGRVLNATEGGAKIEGTVVTTLENVIREFITDCYFPSEILDNIYSKNVSIFDERIINRLIEKIAVANSDFDVLYEITQAGLSKVNDAYELIEKSSTVNQSNFNLEIFIDELSFIRRRFITERSDTFEKLLGQVIQSYFVRFMVEEKSIFGNINRTNQDEIKWILNYKNFFNDMGQMVLILKMTLSEANEKLLKMRS